MTRFDSSKLISQEMDPGFVKREAQVRLSLNIGGAVCFPGKFPVINEWGEDMEDINIKEVKGAFPKMLQNIYLINSAMRDPKYNFAASVPFYGISLYNTVYDLRPPPGSATVSYGCSSIT